MSDNAIFGVDAIMVRDALVQCFTLAHKDSLNIDETLPENMLKEMVKDNVKQAFASTGGDFEQPDKKSILRAVTSLKKFSGSFRNPEVINEHFMAMLSLINQIEEE